MRRTNPLSTLSRHVLRFVYDNRGASAVLMTILASSLIGMVGLGVESGIWFTERRGLQTQADAGAIAGAYQVAAGAATATVVSTGRTEAGNNGYVAAVPNTIAINTPPTSGPYAGNASAVEAILTTPKASILSGVFLRSGVTIRARAVARVVTIGNPCVLALTTANTTGIGFQGNPTVNMPNCILASNAAGTQSIKLQGNPTLVAQNVYAVGGLSQKGSVNLPAGLVPLVGQTVLPDPYASLSITLPGSCPGGGYSSVPTGVVPAGLYCNGMSFASNTSYTLSSGTYYVYNGDFKVNANTTVKVQAGGGVTIILTGSPASKIGRIDINGNATVTMNPSTSGPYKGVLFYQDRNAPANNNANQGNLINGGANLTLGGAIYAPSQSVTFSGNSGSNCLVIIASWVQFQGTANLDNSGCPAMGVSTPTVKGVAMAE
jgi:Flp pilus assembly protein TadG